MLVSSQVGPQILYPSSAESVVPGDSSLNYLSLTRDANDNGLGMNPVASNDKGVYVPPVQMSIRGMIKTFGGVDPVGDNSAYSVRESSGSALVANAPMKSLSQPDFRTLPTVNEYKGLGGDNGRHAPRGLDFQPLGNKVFQIPDGPYTGFMELDSSVEDDLDIDALAARGSRARKSASSSSSTDLRADLQSLLAAGSKLHMGSGAETQQRHASTAGLEKPMMVRRLGGAPLADVKAQEAALLEQATSALADAETLDAETDEAADAAEEAQSSLEASVEEADAAPAAEEQEPGPRQSLIEQEAASALEALEQHYTHVVAPPSADSFLEARTAQQAKADAQAQAEVDELAAAVARDTISRQSALTSSSISKLQQDIRAAKEKASGKGVKPWWATEHGRAQNHANRAAHAQAHAHAHARSGAPASLLAASASARHAHPHAQAKARWNPPAPLQRDPTAFMHAPQRPAYDVPGSFVQTRAADAPAAPAAPSMYANPTPAPSAVRMQGLANPYSFSTADILYPQLRGARGVSGQPQPQAQAPVAPAQANATGATGGNTVVINIAPSAPAPTPAPVAVQRPAPASMAPPAAPVGTGSNPFSLFPGAPAPSNVLHTGGPLPGTPLSDHGSFGQLKV